MKNGKKVIRRMCICNWGGIDHKILEFNEYVNLFSGKSGSGKSTVMDAIQVVMYGSFHQSFLNKAADDTKNRRSVLSYLRGAQKDGTSNREGKDFCSLLVMEIEDTGRESFVSVGVAFEVRKNDTELRKYTFFSHAGRFPENEYLTEEGYPFSNKDIGKLVKEKIKAGEKFGRGEVNRLYPSAESYRRTLYDVILGYIDGNRFTIMEKSAVALRMSNGTGQFIRDYMFPKSQSEAIGRLSEQLGAYRDIREKIDDIKKRIGMLSEIQDQWNQKSGIEVEMMHLEKVDRYIDICDLKKKIETENGEKEKNRKEQEGKEKEKQCLDEERKKILERVIQLKADLRSSDLGSKEAQLEELVKRTKMLAGSNRRWKEVLSGLTQWEENEWVHDYTSNRFSLLIGQLKEGKFTQKDLEELKNLFISEKKNLEERIDELSEEIRDQKSEYEERKQVVEDIRNNQKTYPPELKQARLHLQEKLSNRFGKMVKVHVFADLFDVTDKEWKNAIEGRLGRLKFSLITEPDYAHEAAVIFKKMTHFENVELIQSKEIVDSEPVAKENSVYEAVSAKENYVDACLKRYLGHIIKCYSVEELEQVSDGVTPDCYSYSNFIFRHLRKKDYLKRACIGSHVSKERLKDYETELQILKEKNDKLLKEAAALKEAREYEWLKGESADYMEYFQSGEKLEEIRKQKERLEKEIGLLKNGTFAELEEKLKKEEMRYQKADEAFQKTEEELTELKIKEGILESSIRNITERIRILNNGYASSERVRKDAEEMLKKRSANSARKRIQEEAEEKKRELSEAEKNVTAARLRYISAYPSCGLHGAEENNEAYQTLLLDYQNNYEPGYQEEFDKQYHMVYRSLRDNVIATIHGDIKAAKRHEYEINRLLRQTNFSDSIYQIDIEKADNANGQFYEMLMAEELDSKNIDNDGFDGQLSFGEDLFYQKYEDQIRLLTEKFMPLKGQEDEQVLALHRQQMEYFSDYRNYLSFRMYERVVDEDGTERKNYVDEMAGRDSGGEGQNPKYVALLAGFAMLYSQQDNRESKIHLVLLDEAFSKMDQERSAVCLKYARMMQLQLIVCVPDERLQSLIRNVDCVYGFRRQNNQITMMHIDKGRYLELLDGNMEQKGKENDTEAEYNHSEVEEA